MKKNNFRLFMGCLGNGTTVCNAAVMENGDYKVIAHISNAGNIKWRIADPEKYVPAADMKKIQNVADESHRKFREDWDRRSLEQKYEILVSELPFTTVSQWFRKDIPLENKVSILEKHYFAIM